MTQRITRPPFALPRQHHVIPARCYPRVEGPPKQGRPNVEARDLALFIVFRTECLSESANYQLTFERHMHQETVGRLVVLFTFVRLMAFV